ncbi:MAG: hypothetical protein AMXMBFR13_11570 [Phycisphaerae bacterium]
MLLISLGLLLTGVAADAAGSPADGPWSAWLERRLLPPDEAESAMTWFVDRQLRPLPRPESAAAWQARRHSLRNEVLSVLGIEDLVPPRWDLNIRPRGVIHRESYRIEKLTFESYPGMAVPAVLYVPEGLRGRAPGIVSVGGHAYATGKATEQIQQRNVNLVMRGCVVLTYDYIGTGERNTGPDPFHGKPYGGGNDHGIRSFSYSRRTATGLEVLDGIRALDLLAARHEVDPERLGFTGESGGSNSTYWVAAVDKRVKLAVPVSSVTTFDYWIRNDRNWDYHQRPPGIRRIADIGTLLALHAPAPLLVINSRRGTDDEEFPLEEAEKSVEWAKQVYRLLSAENAIASIESTTGHGYQQDKRQHLYAWVERWLKPPRPRGDSELPSTMEGFEDLRCGLPAGNLTFRDVFAEWLKPLPRTPARSSPGEESSLRQHLRERIGLPDPLPPVKAEKIGDETQDGWSAEFWLVESEPGIRLPGILLSGKGARKHVVLAPGRDRNVVATALAAGHRVLAFDPRGSGEMKDGGGRTRNWAWFAGRPWPGMRALDVLQAARFCQDRFPGSTITVEAPNLFGWPSLLAGAAFPHVLKSGSLTIPVATLHDHLRAEGDYARAEVPGLLERLDVPQIRQLWPEANVNIKP